jgi:hypothetical protein
MQNITAQKLSDIKDIHQYVNLKIGRQNKQSAL